MRWDDAWRWVETGARAESREQRERERESDRSTRSLEIEIKNICIQPNFWTEEGSAALPRRAATSPVVFAPDPNPLLLRFVLLVLRCERAHTLENDAGKRDERFIYSHTRLGRGLIVRRAVRFGKRFGHADWDLCEGRGERTGEEEGEGGGRRMVRGERAALGVAVSFWLPHTAAVSKHTSSRKQQEAAPTRTTRAGSPGGSILSDWQHTRSFITALGALSAICSNQYGKLLNVSDWLPSYITRTPSAPA